MKPTWAAAPRRTISALDCAQSTRRVSTGALDGEQAVEETAPASAVPIPGKRHAQG